VRKALAFTVAVAVSLVGATTFSRAAQQTPPAGTASLSIDDALKSFRADLQGTRADIVAKNITLTADQASKFWPMFNQYQQEQNVIMDEQLKGVQKYVDAYPNLDDATALSLLSAHLQNDSKMVALRRNTSPNSRRWCPRRRRPGWSRSIVACRSPARWRSPRGSPSFIEGRHERASGRSAGSRQDEEGGKNLVRRGQPRLKALGQWHRHGFRQPAQLRAVQIADEQNRVMGPGDRYDRQAVRRASNEARHHIYRLGRSGSPVVRRHEQ
jgi:Spy/CpxP family protein refolding chaperone